MIYLELVLGVLSLATCLYFSYTDIRYNRIKNIVLLLAGTLGLVVSLVGYYFLAKNLLSYYLINIVIAVVVSQILYMTHVWAAGDSKMYICMAIMLPIMFSLQNGRIMFSSIFIATYAFLIGFIYLVGDTIFLLAKREITIDFHNAAQQIKKFIFRYVRNIAMITGLWAIEELFVNRADPRYVVVLAMGNLCILMLISLLKEWMKNGIACLLIICEVIIYFATGILSLKSINPRYYLLIILLMIFRLLVNDGNYKTINSNDVKKGMILSTVTTVLMSNSNMEGLPRISKENMADRLTEEQAEAVRKWGFIKGEHINIQIVKKVPFAIFLTLGMIIEIVIWGMKTIAYM
ncbi:prepilin peptidase [Pseudobutyrivibrio ruminis]|uniref:Prepilin type IV endopeptidase peptidase domain-containing protein n=1 Tax=Pseudobutyrivibrio ruminis TaxID=46206 RepID=A0A2G3DTN5_9FIRM|nr:prepilin peptidase [Pseudobutyrivibrio ruminis]PHU34235.1 hypothetical protein CSX01_11760 [Pseudobutyrivibrio ruminis]